MKLTNVKRLPLWTPKGKGRLAATIAAVLLFAGTATQVAVASATGLPDNAVLRAYGTVVTEEQFQQRLEMLKALYGVQPPADENQRDTFDRDAAKSVAVSHILHRAAQERDIVIADKAAQDTLGRLIEEQMPQGREGFTQFLGNQGISERDVLDEIKRQMESARLFDSVTKDVPAVTDDEVKQAYQDREEDMVSPEKRQLRNIVVGSKQEAKEVLKQAGGGKGFAKLAKRFSLDASTRDKGGSLGAVTRDQLDRTYAEQAFSADKGELFGPVKTQYGWNVGQVAEINPGEQLSYDQVADQLKAELNNQRTLNVWRDWLAERIAEADVEYAEEYQPANPAAPPSDPPPR